MYVLGIETSCDETSASIVRNGREVISCQTSSSLKFHKKYGGIVPEIASRFQLETIAPVTDLAFRDARVKPEDVSLISVTTSPGLLGSLLVGISFAKALSLSLNTPLLGVNHLHSHIYANFLEEKRISFPFIALIVSGGHTSLFYLSGFNKVELIGKTCDDACGEAFDKVAKLLGLGYPGGPYIEKAALKGNPQKIKFKCSTTKNPLDFSFSGIKTAVLYYLKDTHKIQPQIIYDIAASFQEAAINVLIEKTISACKLKKSVQILVGGGVAANTRLRNKFSTAAKESGLSVHFPSRNFCMDNAAMVAGLGYQLYKLNCH